MAALSLPEDMEKKDLNGEEAESFPKRLGMMDRKRRRFPSVQNESKRRASLIEEILALTLSKSNSSLAGKQLQACNTAEDRLNVVSHCLVDKTTDTISTRVSSIRSYLAWADELILSLQKGTDGFSVDRRWAGRGWLIGSSGSVAQVFGSTPLESG